MTSPSLANPTELAAVRANYRRFIDTCKAPDGGFRLTPRADASPYALCFAIFGYRLVRADEVIDAQRETWDRQLRQGLAALRAQREAVGPLGSDKAYLQLLTFTLSALAILGTLRQDPLRSDVEAVLPADIERALRQARALEGIARSGNQAMFLGILMLHARDHLGHDTQAGIDRWVALHRQAMNRFGFWGTSPTMSHLQFQNGYHQYELLEYLHAEDVPWEIASDAVASLADAEGHFAPYPGGGGCYDYDAVFVLTASDASARRHAPLLARTASTLLSEQNADGGFGESQRIRPRSVANLRRSAAHVLAGRGRARIERLRYALTLLRPAHDRIHTHWSRYSREWGESDLWDAWFRMLALARIDCAFDPAQSSQWGFIDYPGIGFHPSLRGGGTR